MSSHRIDVNIVFERPDVIFNKCSLLYRLVFTALPCSSWVIPCQIDHELALPLSILMKFGVLV